MKKEKAQRRGRGAKAQRSQRDDTEFAEKKKEAGQVFPPPIVSRFREKPASLTEGGQPVVCWPAYETPERRKKFHAAQKKLSRIVWKTST